MTSPILRAILTLGPSGGAYTTLPQTATPFPLRRLRRLYLGAFRPPTQIPGYAYVRRL